MFNYDLYLKAMHELDQKSRNARFIEACIGGEIEKINLLLDNKDLNIDMYLKDIKGNDGFRWAYIFHHTNVIKELLFKYNYKLTKRNLNYIEKRHQHFSGQFDELITLINTANLNLSLNISLEQKPEKSKKSKI